MSDPFRWYFLPRVLLRQTDGSYVVCNRRYKPVGLTVTDHIDYARYPVRVKIKGLTASAARKLSFNGSGDLDLVALYDDSCVPTDSAVHWAAYSARLERLAKMKVEPVE